MKSNFALAATESISNYNYDMLLLVDLEVCTRHLHTYQRNLQNFRDLLELNFEIIVFLQLLSSAFKYSCILLRSKL